MKQAAPSESLPYYKWFWRDWRGSRAVYKMTPLQRGLYRELLDEQWKVGAIRDDVEWLAEAARCSVEEMTDAWPVIRTMFVEVGGGWMVNDRMEVQRTEKDRQRVTNSVNGRKGGIAKQTLSPRQAFGKRSPTERHIAGAVAEQSSSTESEANAVAASRLVGASAPACDCEGEHLTDCPNRPAEPAVLSEILATLRAR